MNETIPSPKEEEMTIEKLINQIRELLINDLEQAIEKSGPNWVNKEACSNLVEDLKNKKPVKIGGPFVRDFLDAILFRLNIRSRDEDGRYEAIWKALEKGE